MTSDGLDNQEVVTMGTRRAWSMLVGSRLDAVLNTCLSFFEGVAEAAILTIFARSALSVIEPENQQIYVPGLREQPNSVAIVVLTLLILARVLAALAGTWISARIQRRIVSQLREQVIEAYSSSTWLGQASLDDGDVHQLVVSVPHGIGSQIAGLIHNFGQFAIMLSMIGYSLVVDFFLTLVLVGVIASATFIFRPLRKFIKKRAKLVLEKQRMLSSLAAELHALRLESHVFGIGERISARLRRAVAEEASSQERVGRLKGSVVPLYTMITYFAVTAGIALLLSTPSDNLAQTGPILLVVLRSLSYGAALQQAASSVATLTPSILLLDQRITSLNNEKSQWGTTKFTRFDAVELQSVSFSYPRGEKFAVEQVSLRINSGARVGLVGPSGSGKSTFTKLLLGLVQPTHGEVLVNGSPLVDFEKESWFEQLGVVPQNASVFRGTVAENLRFFRDGISEEDLWRALELAAVADEIRLLPEGLNTHLGSDGITLSGGQQQRLAVARAFASGPRIVVMDEPTSSIDAVSEQKVSDALGRLPRTSTVIIVSHRPRILQDCDQIVVFDNSKIALIGTPDEVKSESLYLQSLSNESIASPPTVS